MPESEQYHPELYMHLKDLFDFIENHDTIVKEIEADKETKEQKKPSKYVKEKVPIYEAFEDLCTNPEINKCTHCIKNYKNYDPKKLLTKLSCGEEKKENGDQDESIKQKIKELRDSPDKNPILYSINDKTYAASDLIPYLMDLLKGGLRHIGTQYIYDYFPSLSNIVSLEKFNLIIASTILCIGGLMLYSIFHGVK
ncbi:hypothetical protein PCYB_081070 [Plasmodium cynomolgi strain B]|uniref:CYIR protein n=1 Tax=Plasmodium cynomolgi (strain B) TaxID=1120755 RepID=K6UD42_PLACD|nr:hypothetical protein PCYB_081070 [Plasmodium cynomolgi strain B]GAB65946.1 hypothetical protein PCYB_081070 [Plasmodium cynomolgi strain B]